MTSVSASFRAIRFGSPLIALLFCISSAVYSQPPASPDPPRDPTSPATPPLFNDPPPAVAADPLPIRPAPFPTSLSGGFGGAGMFGGPGGYGAGGLPGIGGHEMFMPRVNYSAVWYPDQPVRGQNTNLGLERQDLTLSMPVWRDGPDSLTIHTNVRSVLYQTDAILPDSGRVFPNSLWSIGVGTTYTHVFQNGWVLGGGVNLGSSSDQPFHNLTDTNFGLNVFLRVPSGDRNAWLFGASYSPTGELPFPVPLIAFMWNPNDQFSMNIGLPFSIRWQPINDLQIDASYAPLTNIHARLSYRLAEGLGIYAGYDFTNESYFLADRIDPRERFSYYEQKLSAGVRYDITPRAAFDLSGGYSFNRFFFTGQGQSDNHHDRVDVGNSLFMAVRFQIRF